jgi:NAD+ synthase (glutamine-hydrolysing)
VGLPKAQSPSWFLHCKHKQLGIRECSQILMIQPLSGGIDSCATSVIVFSMCRLIVDACNAGDQQALRDVRMVCAEETYTPKGPQDLCNRIFHTCFMGSTNSSRETRSRARELAKAIGGIVEIDT